MRSANPSGRSSSRRPRSRPGRRPLPSRRPGPRFPSLRFRSPWCRPVRERGRGPAASVGRLRDADRGPEVRPSRHGARSGGAPARVLPGSGRRVRRHVAGRVPVRLRPRRAAAGLYLRLLRGGGRRRAGTPGCRRLRPGGPRRRAVRPRSSSTPTATGPAISRSGGSGCIASARGVGVEPSSCTTGVSVRSSRRATAAPAGRSLSTPRPRRSVSRSNSTTRTRRRRPASRTLLLLGETVGPLAIIGASAALGVLWRPAMALAFAQFALLLWLAFRPNVVGRLGSRLKIADVELARLRGRWNTAAVVFTFGCARSCSASHRSRCRTPSRPRR